MREGMDGEKMVLMGLINGGYSRAGKLPIPSSPVCLSVLIKARCDHCMHFLLSYYLSASLSHGLLEWRCLSDVIYGVF